MYLQVYSLHTYAEVYINDITIQYSIQRYCFKIAGAGQLPSQLPLPLNKQIS